MRMTETFVPTLRSTPAEAEIISHQLLLRAGYIRKGAAGVYTYLPFAHRVLRKIQDIIRDEMNKAGGLEVLLPIMQPAELWLETGRWHVYGDEMFRLKDRHNRDFCLGPTHEEIITDLIRGEVSSYRQLPLRLYQIQNKYRDERRPRFGLMRGREFIMKDLYSFDKDEEGLAVSYKKMYDAYINIFTRFGLEFRPVEADSGAIGGDASHEFMVLAENGEASIVYCNDCEYAANIEIAPCGIGDSDNIIPEDNKEMEKVHTPNIKTIEQLTGFMNIDSKKCIKTLFYQADEQVIAVLIRGDRNINEIKVQKVHPCYNLQFASEEKVEEITGCKIGFVGPVGLKNIPVYADLEIKGLVNAICGANEVPYHLNNVNSERDFRVNGYFDFRFAEPGEPCPKCGSHLEITRGIEVGQVFKLGTKYSTALNATYLDENGKENLIVMGCYGIGVTRTMAAAVEQNYDDDGIIWPMSIAPYHVVIIPISTKDKDHMEISEKLYKELTQQGIEVVLDDRNERPGVKFKDADLIGFPIRLTIGKKSVNEGLIEYKLRTEDSSKEIPLSIIAETVINYLRS
ncbi:MAG: prolyl-tRNA synthetase [Clostridiaceae bacterium BRH_c20a]|nr:MAG: prolyl-tRNA synthetase [Clostridiaceae bacterium BRH_c20a]